MRSNDERVVITGTSAITASGPDTATVWKGLLDGECALGPVTRFDSRNFPVRVAGEVPDAWAVDDVERRLAVQTDRWTQLALALGDRSVADAGLGGEDLAGYSAAVVTASSSGGNEFGQVEIERLWSRGPEHVGPYQSIAWFYAATTGQLSIHRGMKGPCGVIASEQAGGLDAIGQARRLIRGGTAVALTGGTEAPIGPYALVCQLGSDLLSTGTEPEGAYLPFDERAGGFVPGEGGAIAVVECMTAARSRSVDRVYGEIAGYSATFDGAGRPMLRRAIELALEDAGVPASEVDVVFADAQAGAAADAAEVEAITAVFGVRGVTVTAPKALYGRLYSGGPAVDVTLALLAMRDGVVPPSGDVRLAPDHPIDLVTRPREKTVRTALVLARGYGGFNAAMVLTSV